MQLDRNANRNSFNNLVIKQKTVHRSIFSMHLKHYYYLLIYTTLNVCLVLIY